MTLRRTVRYAREDVIGYVTLDRPEARNAMDDALLGGIADALGEAHADAEARVVVLRGAGRVFCAGGDVDDMPRRRDEATYRATRLPIERAIARAVHRLDKPLIAQVHGAAIGGGCVLAALCDLRVAAAGTKFGLPEVRYGTTASLGGIYMIARIVGLGRAFELLYLGESFDATRALALGLVNRVVDADALAADTAALARAIADNFPAELALTRRALLQGLDVDFLAAADLETEAAMRAHLGGDIEAGFARARARVRGAGGER
ncbi:MAG: enoyl-CoA hydratase/isomerase family protein [Burkholderiales bacterium]|nr:enoyl-CoA hydratase/isomerase family protein [Burkholderiales bacterium]